MTRSSAPSTSRAPARAGAVALAALTLAALAADAPPASAQSGQEVMEKAADAHETRMEEVSDYTVTQSIDVVGGTVTRRFVKREVDGRPAFVDASGGDDEQQAPAGWGNPYRLIAQVAPRATLDGRESLEDGEAWAVSVDDFSDVDVSNMTPAGAPGEFRPVRATFLLDTERLALRRVVMRGTMETEARSGPVRLEARMDDYREVDGMLHPFRMEISVEGMHSVVGRSGLEQARRRLETLRARRDSLTEAERAMQPPVAERRIERLEELVEDGRLDVTVRVQDLQVNRGAPGGGSGGDAGEPGGGGPGGG